MPAELPAFITDHTERGECRCGQCVDRGDRPDPTGHTVDMAFFKVALRGAEPKDALRETFLTLTRGWVGEFTEPEFSPLDGKEHSYIELGAWIGDQGLALQYMALGTLLDTFRLFTPRIMLGPDTPDAMVQQLAGQGLVTIHYQPIPDPAPA